MLLASKTALIAIQPKSFEFAQQAKIAKGATDNQVQHTEYENTQNIYRHSIVQHKVHNYGERLLKLATDIKTLKPGQRDA